MTPQPHRTTTTRLTLSDDLLAEFLEVAATTQMERTDLIDLLVMCALPVDALPPERREVATKRAKLATRILNTYIEGMTLTRHDVETRIARPVNVTAFRMGPKRDSPTTTPYLRQYMGLNLLDPPTAVWNQARGYWAAQPDAEYIVPARHGWVPYVFRTDDWAQTESAGRSDRIWATSGAWLDAANDRTIPLRNPDAKHPASSWLDVDASVPMSDLDRTVSDALTNQVIAFTVGATNPVVRLRQRGRRLS